MVPDISGSLLDEFTLFSQYSAAANCRANHNGSTPQCGADVQLPVYCDPGKCPDLEVADTVIVGRIEQYVSLLLDEIKIVGKCLISNPYAKCKRNAV